jgi:hypothetical protein
MQVFETTWAPLSLVCLELTIFLPLPPSAGITGVHPAPGPVPSLCVTLKCKEEARCAGSHL